VTDADPVRRPDGRAPDALRPVEIVPNWVSTPTASALIKQGRTWVLCTTSVEDRVPYWRRRDRAGWLTASYNLLPGSTSERTDRERRGAGGRTREIERLIARALRSSVNLRSFTEMTLHVDCDVLQADGGTRTAAVTGGWVALALAVAALQAEGRLPEAVIRRQLAAVSVGVLDGDVRLDLSYTEDVGADTDMNVVMTADGRFVEVQGTAEGEPFTAAEHERMLDLAAAGVRDLLAVQRAAVDGA
jgi:ribonuclease PH